MEKTNTYTAFEGDRLVSKGTFPEVVLMVKRKIGRAYHSPIRIFSDATGNTMDFNFQGTEKEVLRRLEIFAREDGPTTGAETPGPGRPRLGVVSREVSLLSRQWEWLAAQSGGASAVLRRLVDEARKKASEGPSIKQVQERTYKFMSVAAGDRKGYEEALRALYKRDRKAFLSRIGDWPEDIKAHVLELADPVFEGGAK